MSEVKTKPSRRKFRLSRITDGVILRTVFYSLTAIAAYVAYQDYQALGAREEKFDTLYTTRDPVRLVRPETGDQVRPYLPFARPEEDGRDPSKSPKLPFKVAKKVESGPMRFERGPRGRAIAAGRIVPGSAAKLEAFLKAQEGEVKTLVLHSPGGSVQDALQMGEIIRKAKLTTEVPNDAYCASSCPLVFAGGAQRVAGKKSWIGVHQVYATNNARGSLQRGMEEAQVISARCQEALLSFGISPRVWIHAMQTPKEQLYFLTPKQLRDYKLATRVKS